MTSAGTTRPPKLEARTISKTFTRRGRVVTALEDISCTVATGEFVSLVGASGCGKTTLLRIIDGLEQVSSGTIRLDGQDLQTPGPERGFVFQHDTLFPWRTILKNVMLGGARSPSNPTCC